MRIAQISPLHIPVPPSTYGGTERVIAHLTEALVSLGHDVTLFASGDSKTSARLVPMIDEAFGFDSAQDAGAHHVAMLAEVYGQASQFDVIHSHLDYLTLPFAQSSSTPTVITLHGRLDQAEVARAFLNYPDIGLVAISDSQRAAMPDANWLATVHHGIDVGAFPYREKPGDYLAFVGRIAPDKAPDAAIRVATMAGVPLKIAAKVDPKDREYFEQVVEPMLDHPLITWLGPIDEDEKRELLSNALALLLPIDWPEPFGIIFIEALACGTPVITRPRGAAFELLDDGKTGYIRETEAELADAVRAIRNISRAACRAYAERRFDTVRMASNYINVYTYARRRRLFSLGAASSKALRVATTTRMMETSAPRGVAGADPTSGSSTGMRVWARPTRPSHEQ